MSLKSKSLSVQLADSICWSWLVHHSNVISADLGEAFSVFTAFLIRNNKGEKKEKERSCKNIN